MSVGYMGGQSKEQSSFTEPMSHHMPRSHVEAGGWLDRREHRVPERQLFMQPPAGPSYVKALCFIGLKGLLVKSDWLSVIGHPLLMYAGCPAI